MPEESQTTAPAKKRRGRPKKEETIKAVVGETPPIAAVPIEELAQDPLVEASVGDPETVVKQKGLPEAQCPEGCAKFGDLNPKVVQWCRDNLSDEEFDAKYGTRLSPEIEDEIYDAIRREAR